VWTQDGIGKALGKSKAWANAAVKAEPVGGAAPVAGPARMPDPAPVSGGPRFPDPVVESYEPFPINTPGNWLILSDVHIPHHDRRTVENAVEEARRRNAVGVLLNGDIMDCGGASSHHDRDPSEPDLEEEIEKMGQLLAWLRSRLPNARVVWKEGNHEYRLPRYLRNNAPALCGASKRFTLPKLVESENHGVEWVDCGRVVDLGKLPVFHGHEFKGGGGVNVGRWLFLRALESALCGHLHRSSEHVETTCKNRVLITTSVGCACFLHPRWLPNNKWNHGWAHVAVANDGAFEVTNRTVLRDGRVV
jgi:hypothetical protein